MNVNFLILTTVLWLCNFKGSYLRSIWELSILFLQNFCKFKVRSKLKVVFKKKKNVGFAARGVEQDMIRRQRTI